MRHFFSLLNWIALAAVVLSAVFLCPAIGTWWLVVGNVIGAMMTAGNISLRFYRSLAPMPERDYVWRANYFRKPYGKEFLLHLCVTVVLFVPAVFGYCFFAFLCGISMMWLVNISVEMVWACFHRNDETYNIGTGSGNIDTISDEKAEG